MGAAILQNHPLASAGSAFLKASQLPDDDEHENGDENEDEDGEDDFLLQGDMRSGVTQSGERARLADDA